jgi:4-carboxymuconolactone decarboxylase
MADIPQHYRFEKQKHTDFIKAVEGLGKTLKAQGPLDARTAHLIQLAASVAIHSEGAVHSHVRQAVESGVRPDEIYHALILLTSTLGFPTVSAALSWTEDILGRFAKETDRS